jgi:hypothetical protein
MPVIEKPRESGPVFRRQCASSDRRSAGAPLARMEEAQGRIFDQHERGLKQRRGGSPSEQAMVCGEQSATA